MLVIKAVTTAKCLSVSAKCQVPVCKCRVPVRKCQVPSADWSVLLNKLNELHLPPVKILFAAPSWVF
jgi:hypothetical protein